MSDRVSYILFGAILGSMMAFVLLRQFQRWKLKRRLERAKKGEIMAVSFLEKRGYKIVDVQREANYTLEIDGKPHLAKVRADLIVKKGNKTFVAEVKTGSKAPSPSNLSTRRQLLEYFLVYRPHGIILVDMEKKKLRHIKYHFQWGSSGVVKQAALFMAVLFAGLVIGFLTRSG